MKSSGKSRVLRLAGLSLCMAGWMVAGWLWMDRPRHGTPKHDEQEAIVARDAGGEAGEPQAGGADAETGETAEPPEARKLHEVFEEASRDASLAGASLAWAVLDEGGEVVFGSPLAETAMCPASALKILTTGAAFGVLGPDFRFETVIQADSPVSAEGLLNGSLTIVGSGDPTLSIPDLKAMAAALVGAGLKRVTGEVRADASVFPEHPHNDHWNWGDIGNGYGAGAYGLNIGHNRMLVRFGAGDAEGEPAEWLGSEPKLDGVEWRNLVLTGARGSGDRVVVYSQPYGKTITMRGSVPLGENDFAVRAAVPDPPVLAARLLRQFLEESGVKFAGKAAASSRDAPPSEPVELFRHRSATVERIAADLHRTSDNVEAQCLFLKTGSESKRPAGDVVREYWVGAGVDFVGLRMVDGSGLARANMIRPLDLAKVMRAACRGPHGERFRETLSAAHGGRLRSKNGAMSGVRTETGFVRRADGSERIFAMMANGLQPGADFHRWRRALIAVMEE